VIKGAKNRRPHKFRFAPHHTVVSGITFFYHGKGRIALLCSSGLPLVNPVLGINLGGGEMMVFKVSQQKIPVEKVQQGIFIRGNL
jgi:hypothetical protein